MRFLTTNRCTWSDFVLCHAVCVCRYSALLVPVLMTTTGHCQDVLQIHEVFDHKSVHLIRFCPLSCCYCKPCCPLPLLKFQACDCRHAPIQLTEYTVHILEAFEVTSAFVVLNTESESRLLKGECEHIVPKSRLYLFYCFHSCPAQSLIPFA